MTSSGISPVTSDSLTVRDTSSAAGPEMPYLGRGVLPLRGRRVFPSALPKRSSRVLSLQAVQRLSVMLMGRMAETVHARCVPGPPRAHSGARGAELGVRATPGGEDHRVERLSFESAVRRRRSPSCSSIRSILR